MVFEKAVVLYVLVMLEKRAIADKLAIQRMRRRVRVHRRRLNRQRRMLLLMLVGLFVNETSAPRNIWRRTRYVEKYVTNQHSVELDSTNDNFERLVQSWSIYMKARSVRSVSK